MHLLEELKFIEDDLRNTTLDRQRGKYEKRIEQLILESGTRCMRVRDLQRILGCRPGTLYAKLSDLFKEGKIDRVSQGVYVHTSIGEAAVEALKARPDMEAIEAKKAQVPP